MDPRGSRLHGGTRGSGVPIQWFEEPGLAKGAHATIIAVEFLDGEDETLPLWRAVAVGDSCLFQVRKERLCFAFQCETQMRFPINRRCCPAGAARIQSSAGTWPCTRARGSTTTASTSLPMQLLRGFSVVLTRVADLGSRSAT